LPKKLTFVAEHDARPAHLMLNLGVAGYLCLCLFYGGLLRLHEADEAAVDWLTTYGS